MKIGFLFFQFWPNVGGTEIPMYEYAKELVSKGDEVTVYTANVVSFKRSNLPAYDVRDGINIRRFRTLPFPSKYALISPGLVKAIIKSNVQVLQVFSILPSFFILFPIMIAKLRGVPTVLYPQFHPQRFLHHPSVLARLVASIFDKTIAIRFIKMADHVICLTPVEKLLYASNGVRNCSLVYELIPRRPVPSQQSITTLNDRFRLNESGKRILFVGRIDKRKGLDVLIRALPAITDKVQGVKLLIVGRDGGYLQKYLQLAQELGCRNHIVYMGQLSEEEISAAYYQCDLVAVPSYFEAYGRTVLEAWTFKKPVVVSDTVALSGLVGSDAGIIVKCGDSAQLSKAIVELLTNDGLAKRLGVQGYSKVELMSDIGSITEMLQRIYKRVSATNS